MLSSISGLHPLEASSIPHPLHLVVTATAVPRHCHISPEGLQVE